MFSRIAFDTIGVVREGNPTERWCDVAKQKTVPQQVSHLLEHPSDIASILIYWQEESQIRVEKLKNAAWNGLVDLDEVSEFSPDYYNATRVLVAWCDQRHITDVASLNDLHSQLEEIESLGLSCDELRDYHENTDRILWKALQVIQRIDDDAVILSQKNNSISVMQDLQPIKDFSDFTWGGINYKLAKMPAAVVSELYHARKRGNPELQNETILCEVGSTAMDRSRALYNMFKRTGAWGTLIIAGTTKGTYRLADPQKK